LNISSHEKRPWWREPMVWLVIGLPLSAVIAGLTTVYIAYQNADTLVKEGYLKQGFTVVDTLAADEMAANLGLSATVRIRAESLELRLASTATPPLPTELSLTLAHPTEVNLDVVVPMFQNSDGTYLAKAPELLDVKRTVLLEPADRSWRLRGYWAPPYVDTLELKPPTITP